MDPTFINAVIFYHIIPYEFTFRTFLARYSTLALEAIGAFVWVQHIARAVGVMNSHTQNS